MEMFVLFAAILFASAALGFGLWCARQGEEAAAYLDTGLLKAWFVFGVFAVIRAIWFLVTEPGRMDEAGAFLVSVGGAGLVFTAFFWAGHWRARRARSSGAAPS